MKKSKSHLLLLIAWVSTALAGQTAFAAGDATPNPPDATIEMIITYTSYAVLKFSPPYLNQLDCGGANQNDHIVINWKDTPDKKAMLSVALTAYSLQKKVRFGMNGCHKWKGGTPVASRVEIAN